MPKDKLVGLSEELISLSLEMSDVESASKRTVAACFENYIAISAGRKRNLDSKIKEESKNSGIFGWFKGLFGLFKKSDKDKATNKFVITEEVESHERIYEKENCAPRSQKESMHDRIREADHKSVVKNNSNNGVGNKTGKGKNGDIQQNQ